MVNAFIMRCELSSDILAKICSFMIYTILDKPVVETLTLQRAEDISIYLEVWQRMPVASQVTYFEKISDENLRPSVIVIVNILHSLGERALTLTDLCEIRLLEAVIQAGYSLISHNFKEMDQSLVGDALVMLAVLPFFTQALTPDLIRSLVEAVATPLRSKTTKLLISGFVLVVCSCIAVDPSATIEFLCKSNMLTAFANNWLEQSPIEPGSFFRQVSFLAIISLLKNPPLWKVHPKFLCVNLLKNLEQRLSILSDGKQSHFMEEEKPLEDVYYSIEDSQAPKMAATEAEKTDASSAESTIDFKRTQLTNEIRSLLSLLDSDMIFHPFQKLDIISYLHKSLDGSRKCYQN
jgi:hypothetical protein